MKKVILPLLLASCFILAAGCKKENANTSINELLLNNSKWKVFETTYQYTDTTYSIRCAMECGFYLNLNRNREFKQTFYSYNVHMDGKWEYSDTDHKLVLKYEEDPQYDLSYDVVEITRSKLIISRANAVQNNAGYGTLIYELHPY